MRNPRPSTPALVARFASACKGLEELRPAVRIARIVDGVDADEDVARAEHLGPAERERQKQRVARGHVGDGDSARSALREQQCLGSVRADPPMPARSMRIVRCSTRAELLRDARAGRRAPRGDAVRSRSSMHDRRSPRAARLQAWSRSRARRKPARPRAIPPSLDHLPRTSPHRYLWSWTWRRTGA